LEKGRLARFRARRLPCFKDRLRIIIVLTISLLEEDAVPIEVPFTPRPDDLCKFLELLPAAEVPAGEAGTAYFKSLGFSAASGKHLLGILKKLGFVDAAGLPLDVWKEYASAANKAMALAFALKGAYPELFCEIKCPYLEDDEVILDFLKRNVEASPRNLELMLETFRALVGPADFQDFLSIEENTSAPDPAAYPESKIKVNPNLQISIQVHIDPATPDDKIETIFKNMRKYLLGKEN
jgi:hypothetical protein